MRDLYGRRDFVVVVVVVVVVLLVDVVVVVVVVVAVVFVVVVDIVVVVVVVVLVVVVVVVFGKYGHPGHREIFQHSPGPVLRLSVHCWAHLYKDQLTLFKIIFMRIIFVHFRADPRFAQNCGKITLWVLITPALGRRYFCEWRK